MTDGHGVKSALKTTYKGNATINQTVTRTGARTLWGTATDTLVRNTLAAAASPATTGEPSAANFDCSTPAGQASENADGDFFFCAASGTDDGVDLHDRAVTGLEGHQAHQALAGITVLWECRERYSR